MELASLVKQTSNGTTQPSRVHVMLPPLMNSQTRLASPALLLTIGNLIQRYVFVALKASFLKQALGIVSVQETSLT
jgi:hypothetical protein